jgi:hypothetical protein
MINNPPINKEIWTSLRQKWATLDDISKVEFTVLKDPEDETRELAIDVAQNINGEWVVQTVQFQAQEAYPVIGIVDLTFEQLESLATQVVNTVTVPITGQETYDDEMHLVMKRISPETGEIYGQVISKTGERIGIRTNYQHYYVINEILEQKSKIMREEYSEVQLHRKKDDCGRIYFQFIPA